MMKTEFARPDVAPATSGPGIVHSFPRDPRYRLSGQAVIQPGDRARCGWVKTTPAGYLFGHPVTCAVCLDLLAVPLNETEARDA